MELGEDAMEYLTKNEDGSAKVVHVDEDSLGLDLAATHIEGDDALTDRELLEYVAGMLRRLEPLIETLERAQPALASMLPSGDGKKPSPLSAAIAMAKLARS
jgi:hypothetical protein